MEFLKPCSDECFKHLMYVCSKFRNYLLSNLIDEISYEDLEKGYFENVELILNQKDGKKKITDLIYHTGNNIINIEVNLNYSKLLFYKNMAYLRNLCLTKYLKRKTYIDNNLYIQLNINLFERKYTSFVKNKYIHYDKINDINYGSNEIIYHVSLEKVRKMLYNKRNKNDLLFCSLKFLSARNMDELKESINNHKLLKEVLKEYMLFLNEEGMGVMDKEVHEEMMLNGYKEEAREEGLKQGLKEGLEKGKKESSEEIAINMIKDKLSFEKISKYTGLSLKKIKEISMLL